MGISGASLDDGQYSYLLGAYLGDGHINVGRRGVASLSVARAEVESYPLHWPCLFPQHGAGRKHMRPIVLAPWQQHIVEQFPGQLLRGLFHSDGCRVLHRTEKRRPCGMKRYEYPRSPFSDKSTDILDICAAALDRVGVPHRRPRWDMISVAKRGGVAILDEIVGARY